MFLTKARLMTGLLALSLTTSMMFTTALSRGGRGGGSYGRSSTSGYSTYPTRGMSHSYNTYSNPNSGFHHTNPANVGHTYGGPNPFPAPGFPGAVQVNPGTAPKAPQPSKPVGPGANLGGSASKGSQIGKIGPVGIGAGQGGNPATNTSQGSQIGKIGPVGIGAGQGGSTGNPSGSTGNPGGATGNSGGSMGNPKGTPATPKMPQGTNWAKSGYWGLGGGADGGSDSSAPAAPVDGAATGAVDANAAPIAASESAPAVDLSAMTMIVGTWTAQPAKDVTLQATFQADRTFSWTFFVNGKPKSFAGTYSLNGKSLVMVRDGSNEKVEGLLTLNDPSNFNLKANGSEPGDTGLSFAR